jgi:hypothetical protein
MIPIPKSNHGSQEKLFFFLYNWLSFVRFPNKTLRNLQAAYILLLVFVIVKKNYWKKIWFSIGGRRGHDRMVVGFITTYTISAYHHWRCEFEPSSGEVYSIQHYVIKVVSDLWHVIGFFWVLRFPPPIKRTATI